MSRDLKEPLTGNHGEKLTRADLEDLPTPLHRRKFADLPFCGLFILVWVGMIVLGARAFSASGGVHGYERLTNGVQFNGDICGVDTAVKADKYLYWPEPSSDPEFGICVASCPGLGTQVCADVCTDATCKMTTNQCWTSYGTSAVYHYCVPSDGTNYSKSMSDIISKGSFGRMIADLGKAWPALIAAAFVAVIVAFLYLWALWFLGPCLVYSTMIILVIGMAAGGFMLFSHAKTLAAGDQRTAMTAASFVAWGLDLVFVLLVCCLRKSIRVALLCLKQATQAISAMKTMLFLPVIKFFILLLVMIWFVVVSVYLVSAGDFTSGYIHVPGTDYDVPFKKVVFTETLRYSLLFNFFGALWSLAFVMALADVILAGSVGRWYFAPVVNGDRQLSAPVSTATGIAIKRQSGAIALGSLVLAIIWFIKAILNYIQNKSKKSDDAASRAIRFVVCMCRCCISCFECCIKFLERQAYIEMALFGGGFCHSAKRAFNMIARNAGRMLAVTYVGSVFSLLGIVLVCTATCISTYLIVVNAYGGADGVSSPIMPVVVAFLISYVVGSVFMQVLDMSIQTILHCFVADTEASHDGHPVHMKRDTDFTRAVVKPRE